MTTATRPRLMTADDLFNMPDDGYQYELVRGELRRMPPPGIDHGRYIGRIYFSVGSYVMAHNLGEIVPGDPGFELDDGHVRGPDLAFIRSERLNPLGSQPGYYQGPPDVAFEVLSPNDRRADVDEKIADYLDAGTLAVVVVAPRRRTVRVHCPNAAVVTLTESDILEIPELIPGWRMPVADIFN